MTSTAMWQCQYFQFYLFHRFGFFALVLALFLGVCLGGSCRCNMTIAFIPQMSRAESLKAGAGSPSQAANPAPPSRLCAPML